LAQLRHLETVHGIDLGSNDYLGLSTDPRMKQAIRDALDSSSRVASTGSRLLSGHDEVWTAVENDFARWVGAEPHSISLGVCGEYRIAERRSPSRRRRFFGQREPCQPDRWHSPRKCKRVIFPHLDLNALEAELRWTLSGSGARFIVVESIFSMDGDRASLRDLAALAARYDAELIVDEAHATGVCGPGGRGCVAEAGLAGRVFASVHTCGKALAAAGAFVCGSEALRRFLIKPFTNIYIQYCSAPYFAAQVAAECVWPSMRKPSARTSQISAVFSETKLQGRALISRGSDSHLVPIVLGSNEAALAFASRLQARGSAFVRFARRRFRAEQLACACRLQRSSPNLSSPILPEL